MLAGVQAAAARGPLSFVQPLADPPSPLSAASLGSLSPRQFVHMCHIGWQPGALIMANANQAAAAAHPGHADAAGKAGVQVQVAPAAADGAPGTGTAADLDSAAQLVAGRALLGGSQQRIQPHPAVSKRSEQRLTWGAGVISAFLGKMTGGWQHCCKAPACTWRSYAGIEAPSSAHQAKAVFSAPCTA